LDLNSSHLLIFQAIFAKFLRKDATKDVVIRVEDIIRKTTIYAKIAFYKNKIEPMFAAFYFIIYLAASMLYCSDLFRFSK
jgi:hypothetical protein